MSEPSPSPAEPSGRAAPTWPLQHEIEELIERLLNAGIRESTAAQERLEELRGTSFGIEIEGTGLKLALVATEGKLVLGDPALATTAKVRATPLDLLRLVRSGGPRGVRSTRAEITGDLGTAERYSELLKLARPDLEELVSHWVGDIAAHELGRVASVAVSWLERAADALLRNTGEYLQEESRALPTAVEARAFYADVERLRDDVERAAVRLERLAARR
jgi:ubiquinone biosynthesis protein UbiJ